MTVEVTSKLGIRVGHKTYIKGQIVDKEEAESTKQAWIEAGIAVKSETKPKEKNV